ncbi:MAG: pyridine nucleotide-disulfide oxidoreductase, partial [Pseudomonadota bacterium]|nr:pyridine nucleotide-disulfide oxidoreductase [Pseudomonadota bacterium]
HVSALVCQRTTDEAEVVLSAKAIFVATGAKPNIAYEFEHRGTLHREGTDYRAYEEDDEQQLHIVHPPLDQHSKIPEFGPFTSYDKEGYRVSFLGDTHPVFHGSVVKAIASAKRIYPKIIKSLQNSIKPLLDNNDYQRFANHIADLFATSIVKIVRHTESVIELQVRAKMAAHNFQPGQFYRVQNFETSAVIVGNTRLQSEAMAMIGAEVDKTSGLISFMVLEQGASSRLFATFKPGQHISIMGPTGVRTKIPRDKETIMVIGGRLGAAQMQSIGPALRAAGNRVLYVAGFRNSKEVYNQAALEAGADVIVWITEQGDPIPVNRPQDVSVTGDFVDLLADYANGRLYSDNQPPIPVNSVDRVFVTGTRHLVKKIQTARHSVLKSFFMPKTVFIASIYGPMQCMLKGVCAQCLQWQIDPVTGQRTKAVFACSWQDQPMDIVDFRNLDERLAQNRMQESLTNLWLDHLFAEYDVDRI